VLKNQKNLLKILVLKTFLLKKFSFKKVLKNRGKILVLKIQKKFGQCFETFLFFIFYKKNL